MPTNTNHPLQSKAWGEFRSAWGNKVINTSTDQVIFSTIPHTPYTIGTSLKGPIPTAKSLEELKQLGKEERAIFIKLEPNVLKEKVKAGNLSLLKQRCVRGKRFFTPSSFWLDLNKNEDQLLANFSSKTRYNIRLAQRKGVVVKEDNSDQAFDQYLELMRQTIKRQNFYAHTARYHRLMWKQLHPKGVAKLLTATYQGEVITAWILFVWKNFIYYPYGASSDKHKQVMANNLMLWEAIKLGKRLGCTTFDLWGREPGRGFTRFKEGYHPKVVEFIGSWDLIINPLLYWPYRLLEHLRWLALKVPARLGIIKPKF